MNDNHMCCTWSHFSKFSANFVLSGIAVASEKQSVNLIEGKDLIEMSLTLSVIITLIGQQPPAHIVSQAVTRDTSLTTAGGGLKF